jgi:SAM-dependent methyltransferase
MSDYYDANAFDYQAETVNVDPSDFLAPLAERLTAGATVLDIGCGSGRDLLWLKNRGFQPTGFERSPRLADLARRHSKCDVIEGDFCLFDFSTIRFDALLLVGALVHLPRPQVRTVLSGILQALKPGGLVLLTLKEGRGENRQHDGRVFVQWMGPALETVFSGLNLTVRDHSRQISKIRPTDIWLGYLLQSSASQTTNRSGGFSGHP